MDFKLYEINANLRQVCKFSNGKNTRILVYNTNYPCHMDYVDDSKKILKDLLGESMEEDEEEAEVCETSECDRDQSASSDDII